MKKLLRDICYIRSGDKGDVCTAGLIAMTPEAYPALLATVTPDKVKALYGEWIKGDVELYPMDNIQALVVVMRCARLSRVPCRVATKRHAPCISPAAS